MEGIEEKAAKEVIRHIERNPDGTERACSVSGRYLGIYNLCVDTAIARGGRTWMGNRLQYLLKVNNPEIGGEVRKMFGKILFLISTIIFPTLLEAKVPTEREMVIFVSLRVLTAIKDADSTTLKAYSYSMSVFDYMIWGRHLRKVPDWKYLSSREADFSFGSPSAVEKVNDSTYVVTVPVTYTTITGPDEAVISMLPFRITIRKSANNDYRVIEIGDPAKDFGFE